MALIKRRPRIQLRAPAEILPGDRVVLHAQLDAKAEVPVNAVTIRLTATGRSTTGGGEHSSTRRLTLVDLVGEVLRDTTVKEGRTSLACRFDLPADALPSYTGRAAGVEYVAKVHVDIPWWPDASASFVLFVRSPTVVHDAPTPTVFSTRPDGPQGSEPYFELSLADTVAIPGQTLRGSLSLQNTGNNRYEEVRLALVALEDRYRLGGRRETSEAARYGISLDVADVLDGQTVPFGMKLPDHLDPTQRNSLFGVRWQLEARVVLPWRSDLVYGFPLTMLPHGSSAAPQERLAPPTIGDERMRATWEKVAAALGLSFDDEGLAGRFEEVELTLRREHLGKEGVFLVGRVSYPDLGLELDGGLRRGFRRLLGGGVEVGAPAWQREHYLAGRDEEQVRALAAAVIDTLGHLTLVDISDEEATIRRRGGGRSARSLEGFARPLIAFAQRMAKLPYELPAPRPMRDAVPVWQQLAQRMGGRLRTGRMAVLGSVDGAPAGVLTHWTGEGAPLRTGLQLRPTFEIDTDHVRTLAGESWDDAGLPAEARAMLPALQRGASSLSIEVDRLELSLPAPILDPVPLYERLEQLARFAPLLRTRVGPYR